MQKRRRLPQKNKGGIGTMRIIEYIVEVKDNASVPDVEDVRYWFGRLVGYAMMFGVGYVVGSVIRGLLVGFGVI